ncbi:major tail protein [Bacillus wiedmannii]|uniref:Phage tail protein n=1 Tax=Bacillus wiedmannii TaxID=1890302 RepID=A0A2A7W4E6_9BACI|nr:major tail protein [Bacillus wiedmannii]PEJ10199.1 phage tail protein [Bacillus wiedmannii]PFB82939.1 phage tail protein [Bacillus anthracis]PGS20639.1 phage tail protein [Bacillus cereus]PHC65914.1 phage tail protein [Bacillus wiedmannii]
MTKENKVAFGLKNVYYALYDVTDGVVTFKTPIPIPGAVELTFDPRGDLIEFYADDMLYYAASNNQGYDGTLSIATVPEQFAIDALGEQLDETDGVLNELADAKGKPFALLFEFDGDVNATRHVMYNNSASRPTIASKTKTNSAEPNTNELKFVSSPIDINGKRMVKTKTTSKTTQEIYNNWYKEVYVKKAAVPKGA